MSVTGFDDIPFARYTTPTLTTAAVPITELGQQAWHRMRDLIRQVPSDAPAGGPTVFEPKLEVRSSSGTAPATN
jgi:LacI family transcriptional regulator